MSFRALTGFEVWLSLSGADWGLALSEWVIKECKFWWGGGGSFPQNLISTFISGWSHYWWEIKRKKNLKKEETNVSFFMRDYESEKILRKKWTNVWTVGVATLNSLLTNGSELCGYSGTKREDLIIWGAIMIHPHHFQNIKLIICYKQI